MNHTFFGKTGRRATLLALLVFMSAGKLSAQSNIEVLSPQICVGGKVRLNGGLCKESSNCPVSTVREILPGGALGADCWDNGNGYVSPTVTTTYRIDYECMETGAGYAEATVTVYQPTTLTVDFTNESEAVVNGKVCSTGDLIFTVNYSGTDPVFWAYTGGIDGLQRVGEDRIIRFSPPESGILTVAADAYCSSDNVSFTLVVAPLPDRDMIKVDWRPEIGGSEVLCATCGFTFPKDSIHKIVSLVEGDEIESPEISAGAWPIALEEGVNVIENVNVKFTVSRSNHCGAAKRPIDTSITLRVRAKDCRPHLSNPRPLVKPCGSGGVNLQTEYYVMTGGYPAVDLVNAQNGVSPEVPTMVAGDGTVTNGWTSCQITGDKTLGTNQWYSFSFAQDEYIENATYNTSLTVSGAAVISCPYSPSQPVKQLPYIRVVTPQIDTNFLSVDYKYCPGSTADLSVAASSGGKITEIVFTAPDGVTDRLTKSTADGVPTPWEYTSGNVSDLSDYSPLRMKVSYEVKPGNGCEFSQTQNVVAEPQPKTDCSMNILVTPLSGCAGSDFTAMLTGEQASSITLDSIVLDSLGGFTVSRRASEPGQNLVFNPYYDLSSGDVSRTGNLTVTAYYKPAGSSAQMHVTDVIPITVNSCLANIQTYGDGWASSGNTISGCPGKKVQLVVFFAGEPPVDKSKPLDIQYESTSDISFAKGARWNKGNFEFSLYCYENTQFKFWVEYKQGDSLRVSETFEGNFVVNDGCGISWKIEPGRDSCCVGDMIEAEIVNGNMETFNATVGYSVETFLSLEWDESVRDYIAAGSLNPTPIDERTDDAYEEERERIKNYFSVTVRAYPEGIYPFTVIDSMRNDEGGTYLVHRDTLRLTTIAKKHIFIHDTLYACEGDFINLCQEVDSAVIDYIAGDVVPEAYPIPTGSTLPPFIRSAYMRFVCDVPGGEPSSFVKDTLFIIPEESVYLNPIDNLPLCPGNSATVDPGTSGRMTLYKQIVDGDYISIRQVVEEYVNVPKDAVFDIDMETDTLLFTVESRTACDMGRGFAVTQFRALPKTLPTVGIKDDDVFCYSTGIRLQAKDTVEAEVADLKWYLDNATSAYTGEWVYMRDSVDVKCVVTGVNQCENSATTRLRSHREPGNVSIKDRDARNVICAVKGEAVTIEAEGDDDVQYLWYTKDNAATPRTGKSLSWTFNRDTVVYLRAGSGECDYNDSVKVWMRPVLRAETDTAVCSGADFTFRMTPTQSDVTYAWAYAADGTQIPICPCEDRLEFSNFDEQDAVDYKVVMTRNGCTAEQVLSLRLRPNPQLDLVNPKEAYCEGDNAALQLVMENSAAPAPTSWTWWKAPLSGTPENGAAGSLAIRLSAIERTDAGRYMAEVIVDGCPYRDSVDVAVDTVVRPSITTSGLKDAYCEGESVTLAVDSPIVGVQYYWRKEVDGEVVQTGTSYSLSSLNKDKEGDYYLVAVNRACRDSVNWILNVMATPVINLEIDGGRTAGSGDKYFCAGDPVTVNVTGALAGDSIPWFRPGNDTPFRFGNSWREDSLSVLSGAEKTFKVKVVRSGCVSETRTLELDVRPIPELHLADTALCEGGELRLDVSNAAYPGAQYSWKELSLEGAVAVLTQGGNYTVEIDLNGCTSSSSFRVELKPLPVWEFPADSSVCERDSVLLTGPEDADTYQWSDGSNGQTFAARGEGDYWLVATKAGCSDERSFHLYTEFCSPVFFAGAFTPNGDGINDAFGPITVAGSAELDYALYIYDHTGQLVFSTTNIEDTWDGNFKGQPCPGGVYYYHCKAVVKKNGRDISGRGVFKLLR